MMQPQILVLKEGTEAHQGKAQVVSNINACQAVVEAVRTTLGPRGMDKLVVDQRGEATITNDGATLVKLLDIVHPAAKMLANIARSQDEVVGDGTTSVILLAGEFLKQSKTLLEDGIPPRTIIKAVRKATKVVLEKVQKDAFDLNTCSEEEKTRMLMRCAGTSMSSKLIANHTEFFSKMVVDAVNTLDENLPLDMIGIKKVQGGTLAESQLVHGVAFKKTFSYAGFDMQPKKFETPKIALLNIELEVKSVRENAEIRVSNLKDYQDMVDAEYKVLFDQCQAVKDAGANIVLSKLPIGDVATQWFADHDMVCAGRVTAEDMKRTLAAAGGSVLTTVSDVNEKNLGKCGSFEEKQVGDERFFVFKGVTSEAKGETCTIILRGGAEQYMAETERSLHDAIMVVRRTLKHQKIVAGGGATEMRLSKFLRDHAGSLMGKEQMVFYAIAKAFEVIPRTLCDNAGFDANNILSKLRQKHAEKSESDVCNFGVDIKSEGITDNFDACVLEPALVKVNAITAASEATCVILSVDQTIKHPKAAAEQGGGMPAGRGRGMPMMR